MRDMAGNIHQIVYSSASAEPMSAEELADILEMARDNNAAEGITGMLLYRNGHFLQVLEGPEERLGRLVEKLKRDPRHRNIRILLDGSIPARAFGTWSMAFQDVSG